MEKSSRNKTIDISIEEGKEFLEKTISIKEKSELNDIINKTIIGDTFEVLPFLPPKSIDLIIADPPYNLTKDYGGEIFSEMKDKDYEEYTRRWLNLVYPLLKDNGSIYVCCDWKSSLIIGKVIGEKFKIRNRITWGRDKGRGAKSNWKNNIEDIWYATKTNNYTFNLDAVKIKKKVKAPYKDDGVPKDWEETDEGKIRFTCPSNFWNDIVIPFWSMAENTAHPTQKSEKLIAKLILASSNENNIILDPFVGSGTTSVVAKKLNRQYIGIEKSEQFAVWAEKRLEMAEKEKRIQGYENGFFLEKG